MSKIILFLGAILLTDWAYYFQVGRDEASGQIDYFQSGLTFRLKPGADFEAFIRERKAMQRSFSNTDYATVLVDASSIASEYNALQNGPRVTLVTFLKLKTLTNPR